MNRIVYGAAFCLSIAVMLVALGFALKAYWLLFLLGWELL